MDWPVWDNHKAANGRKTGLKCRFSGLDGEGEKLLYGAVHRLPDLTRRIADHRGIPRFDDFQKRKKECSAHLASVVHHKSSYLQRIAASSGY